VWIDGDIWHGAVDCCGEAKRAFAEATGISQVPTSPADPNWHAWRDLHREAYQGYPARNPGQQGAMCSPKESQGKQALRAVERPENCTVLAENGGFGMLIRVHHVYMPDFSSFLTFPAGAVRAEGRGGSHFLLVPDWTLSSFTSSAWNRVSAVA